MAFTNPNQVAGGMTATTALAGVVMHNALLGPLQSIAAQRAAHADATALAAWDSELRRAGGEAKALGEVVEAAVVAMLDAEDEADALRSEVAALRAAVAQRDAAIRAFT